MLTRDCALRYLSTATVAPITSTIRGVPSEVKLDVEDGMKGPCAVNLHNPVTVSQQRLGKRVAHLGPRRMGEVWAALRFSLGCDEGSPTAGEPCGTGRALCSVRLTRSCRIGLPYHIRMPELVFEVVQVADGGAYGGHFHRGRDVG